MNLTELVNHLQADTWQSVLRFGPELAICATILLMLAVRVFDAGRKIDPFFFALAGSIVALYLGAPWKHIGDARVEIFTGMLVYDGFTVFIRAALMLFLVLFFIFTKLSGIPDRDDSADIYTLVLGATLGMCLMASANHLMMVFMAVEMASVPSYALAGLLKGRKTSSEAALKYSIFGAGAAGVMLYGISLLAGLTNTAHLPTIAIRLGELLPTFGTSEVMVLAFAGLLLSVGLAFKLSAVPFHFWAPDVFEGASAEVNAFLSVASKAAALALLLRVCIGIGFGSPEFAGGGSAIAEATAPAALVTYPVAYQGDEAAAAEPAPAVAPPAKEASPSDTKADPLANTRDFIAKLVALFAVVTCTFGNLAAYGQTNIKRLLAYSTIAHAGYMMMPIPAIMAMATVNPVGAREGAGALALYISVYLFMNLGAFAVVAFLRNAIRSEEISDYAGLIRRCPGVVICFALMLFSLIGLPPLAGFVGKFAVFATLVEGYQATGHLYLLVLLLVGGMNTAVSLFYYLRVVKVMTIDPEPEQRVPFSFPIVSLPGMYILAITLPTAVLMLGWNGLNEICLAAARYLLT
ncbi:MAG TPA: NADH-quinone oxidoreductase subunit N [Pirellulaceae bacterium]|nr:NADH-quinone oxidoreductase subunit N [Pirellulaceae bacterium]